MAKKHCLFNMSIYHFFKDLVDKKKFFYERNPLSEFPFDTRLLSCQNKGVFPDMALRLTGDPPPFAGGELVELKDSKSYIVSSFNSTIPSAQKKIRDFVKTDTSSVARQMIMAGDEIDAMPIRDVFYLVRGRGKGSVKVCLLHGSFFETVPISFLIRESFRQVFKEAMQESGQSLSPSAEDALLQSLDKQQYFRQVRKVDKSSVSLRFRVMTEVRKESNILNSDMYPDIGEDNLSLLLPFHEEGSGRIEFATIERVFDKDSLSHCVIQHPFNGRFLVFQASLS